MSSAGYSEKTKNVLRIKSVIAVSLTHRFGCKLKHCPPLSLPILKADAHFLITKTSGFQVGVFFPVAHSEYF